MRSIDPSLVRARRLVDRFFSRCTVPITAMAVTSFTYGATPYFNSIVQDEQLKDTAITRKVEALRARSTSAEVSIIDFDVHALSGPQAHMRIPNVNDLLFNVRKTPSAQDFVWEGTLEGRPGHATLAVHKNRFFGTIRDGAALYKIESVVGQRGVLVKVNSARFPKSEPSSFAEIEKKGFSGELLTALSNADTRPHRAQTVIDVLVAYTPDAARKVSDIEGLIQVAIAETNQSYVNSGVKASIALAGTLPINYSEAGKTFDSILFDFRNMPVVRGKRDALAACRADAADR